MAVLSFQGSLLDQHLAEFAAFDPSVADLRAQAIDQRAIVLPEPKPPIATHLRWDRRERREAGPAAQLSRLRSDFEVFDGAGVWFDLFAAHTPNFLRTRGDRRLLSCVCCGFTAALIFVLCFLSSAPHWLAGFLAILSACLGAAAAVVVKVLAPVLAPARRRRQLAVCEQLFAQLNDFDQLAFHLYSTIQTAQLASLGVTSRMPFAPVIRVESSLDSSYIELPRERMALAECLRRAIAALQHSIGQMAADSHPHAEPPAAPSQRNGVITVPSSLLLRQLRTAFLLQRDLFFDSLACMSSMHVIRTVPHLESLSATFSALCNRLSIISSAPPDSPSTSTEEHAEQTPTAEAAASKRFGQLMLKVKGGLDEALGHHALAGQLSFIERDRYRPGVCLAHLQQMKAQLVAASRDLDRVFHFLHSTASQQEGNPELGAVASSSASNDNDGQAASSERSSSVCPVEQDGYASQPADWQLFETESAARAQRAPQSRNPPLPSSSEATDDCLKEPDGNALVGLQEALAAIRNRPVLVALEEAGEAEVDDLCALDPLNIYDEDLILPLDAELDPQGSGWLSELKCVLEARRTTFPL